MGFFPDLCLKPLKHCKILDEHNVRGIVRHWSGEAGPTMGRKGPPKSLGHIRKMAFKKIAVDEI